MRGERVIEWRASSGSLAAAGEATVTPLARSLILRWPRGGAVWSGPAAIVVERDGQAHRIPVANLNGRVLWGLRGVSAVALIAMWLARNR